MEKEQLQELIENNKEDIFSEIKEEISDETVTDIEWDGYNLWITQLGRGCYISMKELSDRYMDNLSIRLANIMGASFMRQKEYGNKKDTTEAAIWTCRSCQV